MPIHAGGESKGGDQNYRGACLERRAEVKAPGAYRIGDDNDREQEQKVERTEPVIASGVDASAIVVLQPICADNPIAGDERKMFAPLRPWL